MKTHKPQTHWMIDAALFAGFLVSFWLDLTGVSLHQWLGVAVAALAGYHLLAHWNWVEAVTARLFGQTSGQARRYYLVDAGVLAGFLTILATGLVISTWLALPLGNYAAWLNVHIVASIVTVGLVVLKIGMHWRWIAATARRIVSPPAPAGKTAPVRPAPAAGRREFLKLMGIVGLAAALAASNTLDSFTNVQGEESVTEESSATSSSQSSSSKTAVSGSQSSTACVIRCNRGCAFPGHCRKYVDSDGNNRCDLGECA